MKSIKNAFIWQAGIFLVLLASWALLRPAFFRMHDYTHVARLVELVSALRAGHFPAIWAANFGWGYGMPLFLFYGPLPFYLASLPVFIGFSYLTSIKLLIFSTHLLAWWGMYKLLSRWGRTAALVGATAFLFAPYRAVDLYVRGALNELFALSLLPWITHFSWQITRQDKLENQTRGWLGLSLSSAALVLSHNLTAFFASPFLVVFGLAPLINRVKNLNSWWKKMLVLVAGWIGGGVLSLFYILPAFLEKNETIVSTITQGYFNFNLHFLYIRQFFEVDWAFGGSSYGPHDDISFHLGQVTLLLVVMLGIAWLARWRHWFKAPIRAPFSWNWLRQQEWVSLPVVTGLLLLISLWLTTFHAQPVWQAISLLQFIQFPWRFLAVSNFLLAWLAGWGFSLIKSWWKRWALAWLAILLIVITQIRFHHPESFLGNNNDFYYTDQDLIRRQMSDILFDYMPSTFNLDLEPIGQQQRVQFDNPESKLNYEYNLPQEYLIQLPEPRSGKITWNLAHFPGWHYTINQTEVTPNLNEDGLMTWEGKGIQSIGAYYQMTPLRRTTAYVSFTMLLIWLTIWSTSWKKHREHQESKHA